MKILKVLILGFGSAAKAYIKLINEKEKEILDSTGYKIIITGIITGTRGSLTNNDGIDLKKFDSNCLKHSSRNNFDIIDSLDYDLLVELTPLNMNNGQPAINHIKGAFNRGKHVVTANKGPIAFAYKELKELAKNNNSMFFYETTVMDGTPIFNLYEETLPLCKVLEVSGIFNTTTNFVLIEMAKGKTYEMAIEEGKKQGFVEADPKMDIEGYDSVVKTTALLNVLMDANINPLEIKRKGIEDITKEEIDKALERGKIIKLFCRGYYDNGQIKGEVFPKEVDISEVLATIDGTSSIIKIKTDLMGEISVIEHNPQIEQTGYGIFSDTLRLIKKL